MLNFILQPFEVHGKNENAMQTLKIKTHRMSTAYGNNHFFLLSKGHNAGKPLEKPCFNCFVVIADSQADKEKLFWICYCLWRSGKYIPLLLGSVIPFLHIKKVKKEITIAASKALAKPQEFQKLVRQLQAFHKLETHLHLQLKLVTRIKGELAYRFLT
jgi:hypothetical protein